MFVGLAAVALAGCGRTDAEGGGDEGCPVDGIPYLENACPSAPVSLPPLVQPVIESLTVSPSDIESGQSVTITSVFAGEGSVRIMSSSGAIVWNAAITSGVPKTSPPLGDPGQATVTLVAMGLVGDGLTVAEVSATSAVSIR